MLPENLMTVRSQESANWHTVVLDYEPYGDRRTVKDVLYLDGNCPYLYAIQDVRCLRAGRPLQMVAISRNSPHR
jgi:hypothetical protein